MNLPYIEPKNLTARSRAANLEDHMLRFMAAHGFEIDVERELNDFERELMELGKIDSLGSVESWKRRVWALHKLGDRCIKLGRVQNLVASAWGYRDYNELRKHISRDGSVRNISAQGAES